MFGLLATQLVEVVLLNDGLRRVPRGLTDFAELSEQRSFARATWTDEETHLEIRGQKLERQRRQLEILKNQCPVLI